MALSRVMIVEDESIIAHDLARCLRQSGFEVMVAHSVEESLKKIRECRPEVVLMDIGLGLGQPDGVQGAERVKAEFQIPVVFLTSYADSHTVNRAKHTRPSGYLLKPFRQLDVSTAIELALYNHQAQIEIREHEDRLSAFMDGFQIQ